MCKMRETRVERNCAKKLELEVSNSQRSKRVGCGHGINRWCRFRDDVMKCRLSATGYQPVTVRVNMYREDTMLESG